MKTLAVAHVQTQYHQIWLRTISDLLDPESPQMDADKDNVEQGVTAHPPFGAVITTRAGWGPVTIVLTVGLDPEIISSDPEFAHMDGSWGGTIALRDSSFYITTFDNQPNEMSNVDLGRPGEHRIKVEWRYGSKVVLDENDPDQFEETVIISIV